MGERERSAGVQPAKRPALAHLASRALASLRKTSPISPGRPSRRFRRCRRYRSALAGDGETAGCGRRLRRFGQRPICRALARVLFTVAVEGLSLRACTLCFLFSGNKKGGLAAALFYSHSMVPGGLEVTSRTTRLTPRTSLTMRAETRRRRSSGRLTQSAVMPSEEATTRRAMT